MAYVDQDRSRERLISGTLSFALVGAVGFALASGLAITVNPIKVWRIPTIPVHPLPPPPEPKPQPRLDKQAKAMPQQTVPDRIEVKLPDIIPLPPVTPKLGTSSDIPVGPTGESATPTQLEPAKPNLSVGVSPRGRPGDWVSSDDYPPSAERAGVQGHTGFRLDIGADGKPIACTIVNGSGSAELDAAACRLLMKRARFTPARGADGQPVASSYSNGVDWRLPGN